MPENTAKVDRSTRYGNPFRDSAHDGDGIASIVLGSGLVLLVDDWWSADVAVNLFEQWMMGEPIQDLGATARQEPSVLVPAGRAMPR